MENRFFQENSNFTIVQNKTFSNPRGTNHLFSKSRPLLWNLWSGETDMKGGVVGGRSRLWIAGGGTWSLATEYHKVSPLTRFTSFKLTSPYIVRFVSRNWSSGIVWGKIGKKKLKQKNCRVRYNRRGEKVSPPTNETAGDYAHSIKRHFVAIAASYNLREVFMRARIVKSGKFCLRARSSLQMPTCHFSITDFHSITAFL